MNTTRLLLAELLYRKTSSLMILFALTAAATLLVAGPALIETYSQESSRQLQAMQQETDAELGKMQEQAKADINAVEKRTKRIMRDLGFNLRIVHQNTDMSALFSTYEAYPMPEEYLTRLATAPEITKIVHLVATVKQMVRWENKPRLMVGFAPEATQPHVGKKPPMGFQIKQGEVFLGALAGKGHQVDEEVDIMGQTFKIARILPPHGSRDEDILIAMHLSDAQKLLNLEGKLTEILALGCKCKTVDRVEEITQQLELVLGEAKVTEMRTRAIARDKQRELIAEYHQQAIDSYKASRQVIVDGESKQQLRIGGLIGGVTSAVTPLVVLVCSVWTGMLLWTNVQQRRSETGLLRALGKGSGSIAMLFSGKAVLLGLVAGASGCVLGGLMAYWVATGLLEIDPARFAPSPFVFAAALLGSPLLAVLASYLPTLAAVRQDPATLLMEA